MKEKNIERAAHALYLSQGDDKNAILASNVVDPEVAKTIKDQGRALIVLEKLLLPHGQFAYEEDEMTKLILSTLESRGHRIQGNEEEDQDEFVEEKRIATENRLKKVPMVLGKSLTDLEIEKQEKKQEKVSEPDIFADYMKNWNDPVMPEAYNWQEEQIKIFSNAEFVASAAIVVSAVLGTVVLGAWLLRR